jgi:hypothetical protein
MINMFHAAGYENLHDIYFTKHEHHNNFLTKTITVVVITTEWGINVIESVDIDAYNSIKSTRFPTVADFINNYVLL